MAHAGCAAHSGIGQTCGHRLHDPRHGCSSQHSFAFPLPYAARSTPAAYAVLSYFYWIWCWDGPGTSTAVVRVWRWLITGPRPKQWFRRARRLLFSGFRCRTSFCSQLDFDNALTRPHHDTSTGIPSTFCLNPRLYSLIIQGLHPTSRTATTDVLWTLVCERRQDMGQLLGAAVSVSVSMGTRAPWDTATDANDPKGTKDGRDPTSEVHGQNC